MQTYDSSNVLSRPVVCGSHEPVERRVTIRRAEKEINNLFPATLTKYM